MTPSELKALYYRGNPDGHFFDRKTMTFFGDTMRNFGVRGPLRVLHWWAEDGNTWLAEPRVISVWELYRRRPVKHGLRSSHYFDAATGNEVHTVEPAPVDAPAPAVTPSEAAP